MKNRDKNKRWYDKVPYTNEVLAKLEKLTMKERYDVAREVISVVETIKVQTRELEEAPLSIGLDRVLGLYKEQNKRRWYDNSLPLARVFKTASCLSEEDFSNIMLGMEMALREESAKDI
jgi:hypothetical protein